MQLEASSLSEQADPSKIANPGAILGNERTDRHCPRTSGASYEPWVDVRAVEVRPSDRAAAGVGPRDVIALDRQTGRAYAGYEVIIDGAAVDARLVRLELAVLAR